MSKIRGFEVVKKEFKKLPEDVKLPENSTEYDAGYDFFASYDMVLQPNEQIIFPTDVKAYMQNDEVLYIFPRSSYGIKKGIVLSNTVGVIDSGYYENTDNDGNIHVALKNTGKGIVNIKQGDKVCQGVFMKVLRADNHNYGNKREGGIGSTGE
jgi:dUTP pyrophosphatase